MAIERASEAQLREDDRQQKPAGALGLPSRQTGRSTTVEERRRRRRESHYRTVQWRMTVTWTVPVKEAVRQCART